jgi:primosomal protein N' (replication factor Y)
MYAQVAIARPVTRPFTYAIPPTLSDRLAVGHVVLVPFGARGAETGFVVDLVGQPEVDPARIKPIQRLLDPEPAFDARQLDFFRWVADYYLAPLGMVIHTATPSEIRARVVRVLQPTEDGVEALTAALAGPVPGLVLREVISRPGLTRRGLVRRLEPELRGEEVTRAVDTLVRRGWAQWTDRELSELKGRVRTVSLAASADELSARAPRAGRRMKAVVEALADVGGPVDLAELVSAQGETVRSALARLEAVGLVAFGEREDRDVLLEAPALGSAVSPVLNRDQQNALEAITTRDAQGAFLLHGVTGSGKTEVFLGAARYTLDAGRRVLVLVPEIGLTPQLVGRFRARFGDGVAVLHSGLTGGERVAQWRRIRAGEARIAVGARSALFAPFDDLGLLVVDEEHDDSYKQDEGVRYNARDLAVVLGRRHQCPVVLASATPSLESWHNAETSRYTLLRLPHRATPRPVPEIELVDLTGVEVPRGEARPLFAPEVVDALQETFDAGGQAIVLYNRRGYATLVQCTSCGGTYECPNCGITMTLHRSARAISCHYCGLKRPYQQECPACGDAALEELGKGTERIEEELQRLFPDVPRARMDADTTAVRGAHHRILSAFRAGDTRLLVGTQIVAKGHDFPGVHTAVVVSADHGFRLPDFRAAERTGALLVQVAGRAGRGEVPGRVLVQTWQPDHYVLRHLDDQRRFLLAEARLRSALRYPPYTRLCLVRLDGVERRRVLDAAVKLARELRSEARGVEGVDVLGPAPAALAKLVGRWRFQILLRGRHVGWFRRFLANVRGRLEGAASRGVRVVADVDPRHLM